MEVILLAPPVAFVVYLVLVGILSVFGRMFAARGMHSAGKHATYAGGEESPVPGSLPGYRGFFIIALFFAVLHLGVLMLGSSNFAPIAGAYLIGLIVALLVLIVG
jgi:NADH:ubiquinone oxidoreductase subunit 3 (subunit A)